MAKKNPAAEPATAETGQGPSFEEALERLETIVEELEGGSLTLEQSIARYEEGVKLSRRLTQTLDRAEKRIERLTEGGGGEPEAEPMDLDEAEEEPPRPARASERVSERAPAAPRVRPQGPPPGDELPF
jgi:exodeoxyribonuclease VII small subunit